VVPSTDNQSIVGAVWVAFGNCGNQWQAVGSFANEILLDLSPPDDKSKYIQLRNELNIGI